MRLLTPLAATAALLLAGPVLAQEAAPTAPAAAAPAAPERVKSAEELALEADAQAFQSRMQAMRGEIGAAMQASAGDQAKATADIDLVLARYQPEIDGFAGKVETFLNGQAALTSDEGQKQGLAAAATQASASIRTIPDQVRASVQQAFTAAATAPAAAPASQ